MMKMLVWFCLFIGLSGMTNGLQWQQTANDGITITVCEGSDVTFPWGFDPDQGDTIFNTEWLFNGPPSQLLAFNSHTSFMAVNNYADRVQQGANGSLTLRHVTQNDKGSYSIEVYGSDVSGTTFRLKRTVYLNVTGLLLTKDRPLQAEAMTSHDDVTDTLSLQLSCGVFPSAAHPEFAVEWLTPSGQIYPSTGYENGKFLVKIPTPVETGQYMCRIPDYFSGHSCLPANTSSLGQASVYVDLMQVRVAILEAGQKTLKAENRQLKHENEILNIRLLAVENETARLKLASGRMEHVTQALVQNVTRLAGSQPLDGNDLTGTIATLQHGQVQCLNKTAMLEKKVENLDNATQTLSAGVSTVNRELKRLETSVSQDTAHLAAQITSIQADPSSVGRLTDAVSFHAQLASNVGHSSGETLVLTYLYNNNGNAYDNTTGIFTAPSDGTYFFIASTGSFNKTRDAYMDLVVDGDLLATAFAHSNSQAGEMATCHAVVNLHAGQRVWLRSRLNSFFNHADTIFSGFLVH